MRVRTRLLRRALLHAAAAVLLGRGPVAAQDGRAPTSTRVHRVPVIVAIAEPPTGGGRFEIVRRKSSDGPDIILLTDSAGPAALSDAVRALMVVRRRDGDAAPATARIRTRPNPASTAGVIPWAPRVLDDVRARPVQPLGAYGPARWVQIWLPRTHGSPAGASTAR